MLCSTTSGTQLLICWSPGGARGSRASGLGAPEAQMADLADQAIAVGLGLPGTEAHLAHSEHGSFAHRACLRCQFGSFLRAGEANSLLPRPGALSAARRLSAELGPMARGAGCFWASAPRVRLALALHSGNRDPLRR